MRREVISRMQMRAGTCRKGADAWIRRRHTSPVEWTTRWGMMRKAPGAIPLVDGGVCGALPSRPRLKTESLDRDCIAGTNPKKKKKKKKMASPFDAGTPPSAIIIVRAAGRALRHVGLREGAWAWSPSTSAMLAPRRWGHGAAGVKVAEITAGEVGRSKVGRISARVVRSRCRTRCHVGLLGKSASSGLSG